MSLQRIHQRSGPRSVALLCGLLLAVGLLLFPQSAKVDHQRPCGPEPTDETINYGDVVRCAIDPVGDLDLFRFQGSEREVVAIQVTRQSGSNFPCYEVLGPSGAPVSAVCSPNTGVAQGQFELRSTGTYTIRVAERFSSSTIAYSLFLQRLVPPLSATPIGFQDNLSGDLSHVGEIDTYLFSGTAGATVRIQITRRSGSNFPCFGVFLDPRANPIRNPVCSPNTGIAADEFQLRDTGTYTIRVGERFSNSTMGYTIFLQCTEGCPGKLAVVSAASFSGTMLAIESIVAAFGTALSTATESASTTPLPTTLAGTTVKVSDSAGTQRDAGLFFVSPGQVNFQIPQGSATGTATAIITSGNGLVSVGTVEIVTVAPGLFTANADGQGVAAAVALRVRADGSQSFEPIARYDPTLNPPRFVSVPLDLGPSTDTMFLILYGTGIRYRSLLTAVTASIGGTAAYVEYAGPVSGFVGLDQVNVRMPQSLVGRGEVDVTLVVDGKQASTVRVSIK